MKEKLEKLKGLKILIVEDDKALIENMKKLLTTMQFDFTIKENGKDGLDEFLKNDYEAILSDINMPVMTGIEMAEQIRNTYNSDIPIVFFTAHTELEFVRQSQNLNINDYLNKPFDILGIINALYKIKFPN
jgi:CheY-like chemotaxis protein